ncbi:hypothetical protein [Spirosoma validum]|uniref:Uncharacterized protein n=1 Tax=Spirosoma validum TaxID=2771355 RepID=A0A927AXP8_9BACT|nr:hypothetical protein [Spirosoma validum]MBD2751759.1 hypothetical protein [Spirosoma validum]
MTVKELAKANQPLIDSEKVSINGESFVVSTTQKSVYSYDNQGRILTEYNTYTNGKADSVLYLYTSEAVTIRATTITPSSKTSTTNVVALNSQGWAEHRPDTYKATYDKEGYLTSLKYAFGDASVINGNVVDQPFGGDDATPTYTYRYQYDLNKAGVAPIQTFYGKGSRNLLTRYVIENDRHDSIYGDSYIGDYDYLFDEKGRIKRQTFRGKQGELIGFLFEADKVIVKEFTYICPQ